MSDDQAALADLATPVLRELTDLLANPTKAPPFADLQARYHDLITGFATAAAAAGIPHDDLSQARYALTAVVDESVMLSEMEARDEWLSSPLQLRYFDEVTAGEEFYNRIDLLRMSRKHGVLEVYWLCLAFGFKGKFGDKKGGERRRMLQETLAGEIAQARGQAIGAPLSPHAAVSGGNLRVERWRPLAGPRWWLVPIVVAAALLAVHLICGFLVGASIDAAAARIGGAS